MLSMRKPSLVVDEEMTINRFSANATSAISMPPKPYIPESSHGVGILYSTGTSVSRIIPKIPHYQAGNTILNLPLIIGTSIQLDNETTDMCHRKGLLQLIPTINEVIYTTYHNIHEVKFKRIQDSEAPEYEKLHCKLYLRSKPDQILKDENEFYDKFFSKIPEDKQDLFVITYKVS